MDWSLVLASQDIGAEMIEDESGYSLAVREEDYPAACEALRDYARENPALDGARPSPSHRLSLHPGSIVWAGLMVLLFVRAAAHPELKDWGVMDRERFLAGEWWRPLTAMGLHADAAHLISNLTFGVIFLGLAMSAYGLWPALLISIAAGAMGNLLGLLAYPPPYSSLGASGMVMAALGLLAAFAVHARPAQEMRGTAVFRGVGAAVLMLVLIGFSPQSDIVAHLGGFFFGVIGGLLWRF